jgi:TPR repeat protein
MNVDQLRKEAENGILASRVILGVLYCFGDDGVPVDYAEAFRLLEEPARQGVPRACECLAHMFASGLGVAKNKSEAARLFLTGARRNDFLSMLGAARLFATDDGEPYDPGEARRWYGQVLMQASMVCDCDDELAEALDYLSRHP